MTDILVIIALVLLVVTLALLWLLYRKSSQTEASVLIPRLDAFEKALDRMDRSLRDEISKNRDEQSKALRDNRQEQAESFRAFGDTVTQRIIDAGQGQKAQIESMSDKIQAMATGTGERLDGIRTEFASGAKLLREEVVKTLNGISEVNAKTMGEFGANQTSRLEAFSHQLITFSTSTSEKLDAFRTDFANGSKQLREEVVTTQRTLSETTSTTMKNLATAQTAQLDSFSVKLTAFSQASGEKLDSVRNELAQASKQLREEVVASVARLSETVSKTMNELGNTQKEQLATFANASGVRFDAARHEASQSAKQLREEVIQTLTGITEATTKTMAELALRQQAQLETMTNAIATLATTNESKLEAVRVTVEAKLQSMQSDNAKQLEQMRQTVDEKLQGTLEKRLGESFKQVSERLELVHKGLGEMQALATGVGDLKKVLTNVKTRGTWGEVQLGALLDQVLNTEQYAKNVSTKSGGERVEFAIKLPGQGTDEHVWLPIDAKFPIEDYQRLIDAQERGDVDAIESAGKQLEIRVKQCAADISEKYLNPPQSTDFGILYLPIEGLFAEVIRRTALTDAIQRQSRVVIAGPTTLWSILNSLQMGFRTLAIQKRSSEVWTVLGAVKNEWTKYGEVLEAVKRKLTQASDTIDKAQVRSRAIGRKLKDVQMLPAHEMPAVLSLEPLIDGIATDDDEPAANSENGGSDDAEPPA